MAAQADSITDPPISVRKLHPALGAEVRGIDMRRVPDAATFVKLHDIWMEHLVLVFPDQHVTDDQHVAFARLFGEPEIFHQKIIKSRRAPEIFRVSNVDEDGVLMPPDHPVAKQVALAQLWHTDSSYRRIPCMGALLHGVEVSRTGGETEFVNLYAVYDALPDSLKRQVEGRTAQHNFGHMHVREPALKPLTDEEKAAMPPVWQPLVRTHPVTGRKSLYISPLYNDAVEAMDDSAGAQLIRDLTAFAAQPRFVYRHRWETDDMLLWDNRCTMHQVTPFDPTERRVMHRTTFVGTGPVMAA